MSLQVKTPIFWELVVLELGFVCNLLGLDSMGRPILNVNTPLKLSSVHSGWTSDLLDLSLGLMLSYISLPHARNR